MIGCYRCRKAGVERIRQVHVYVGTPGQGQAYGGGFPLCWDHYNSDIADLLARAARPGFEARAVRCDVEGRLTREIFRARRREPSAVSDPAAKEAP